MIHNHDLAKLALKAPLTHLFIVGNIIIYGFSVLGNYLSLRTLEIENYTV